MMKLLYAIFRHVAFTIYCVALLASTIFAYYALRENEISTAYRWMAVLAIIIVGCGLFVLVVRIFFPDALGKN
ncbi:hypothetical protein AB833_12285 [Chromatiales bacterium (ex Bugula neritina AB1)]|nr:hypothetical protein AB833_12285 [Chromatiales bacterium (ex Bugula neritina AB1)]